MLSPLSSSLCSPPSCWEEPASSWNTQTASVKQEQVTWPGVVQSAAGVLLTVSWGPVCACGSGTGWSWWSAVCICVWWSEASRWGSRRSVPELSRSSYWASPEQVEQKQNQYAAIQTVGLLAEESKLHLLPHLGRKRCSLDHLHVEETLTWNITHTLGRQPRRVLIGRWRRVGVTFLLPDGGVLTVGQRAGRAVTQPCDVELIPTEALTLGPGRERNTKLEFMWRTTLIIIKTEQDSLDFEGAELFVPDDVPDHLQTHR